MMKLPVRFETLFSWTCWGVGFEVCFGKDWAVWINVGPVELLMERDWTPKNSVPIDMVEAIEQVDRVIEARFRERYCDALRTWMRIQRERGVEYADALGRIELDISKSNLLARMIYGGESLRTRQCPIHKGRWSGLDPCPEGCDSTGWLPNERGDIR